MNYSTNYTDYYHMQFNYVDLFQFCFSSDSITFCYSITYSRNSFCHLFASARLSMQLIYTESVVTVSCRLSTLKLDLSSRFHCSCVMNSLGWLFYFRYIQILRPT